MNHLRHIVTRDSVGADILRIVLCLIIFTHGAYRFYEGTTPIMGTLLGNAGFPFRTFLAYAVNVVETAGALLITCLLFTSWEHHKRLKQHGN